MLNEYLNCLDGKKIPYYWNKNNNLISGVNSITITNIANKIKAIIEDVKKTTEPSIIAKHLRKYLPTFGVISPIIFVKKTLLLI